MANPVIPADVSAETNAHIVGRFFVAPVRANRYGDIIAYQVMSRSKNGSHRSHFSQVGIKEGLSACITMARALQIEADRNRERQQTAREQE